MKNLLNTKRSLFFAVIIAFFGTVELALHAAVETKEQKLDKTISAKKAKKSELEKNLQV